MQEEQADGMLLNLAMSGDAGIDHAAGAKKLNTGDVNPTLLTEFLVGRHPKRVRAAKAEWESNNDGSLIDRITGHNFRQASATHSG